MRRRVRYTGRINEPNSRFDGQLVSVSYRNGVPDFSPYGVVRVNIPTPVGRGRGPGINDEADLIAATRELRAQIEAGSVSRSLFDAEQSVAISRGLPRIPGLSWHHDGLLLNADGSGPMLLVERWVHRLFTHQGWASNMGGR